MTLSPATLQQPASVVPEHSGVLAVDRAHPFFFDHPLDHVPGILTLTGMLDRVRAVRCPDLPAARVAADFAFPCFAELDEWLVVEVEREVQDVPQTAPGQDAWSARTTQGGVDVATARIAFSGRDSTIAGFTDAANAAGAVGVSPGTPRPADAELVHRARVENIMLGVPQRSDAEVRIALLSPPSRHFFTRRDPLLRTAEEIAEGARQLAVLMWQFEYGREASVQLLLDSVHIDVPLTLRRAEPVELRWTRVPRRGTKGVFSVDIYASSRTAGPDRAARPVGHAVVATRAMARPAYLRMRASATPAVSVSAAASGPGTGAGART